jgi:hypothetical protein
MAQYTSRLRSRLQARSSGNHTLGLKSMAQVLKPTPVAQVDFNGRNLNPARRQNYSFSLFFRFGFPESAFHFFSS